MNMLGGSHGTSFQVYPQTNLLVPQRYTNIHSNQHFITKLTWIHLVHTCNIWIFDTVTISIIYQLIDDFIRKYISSISHTIH